MFSDLALGDQADTIIKKSGLWGQVAGTKGLNHSFSEHASQWFGREVSSKTHMGQWQSLIQQAAQSSNVFQWSVGDASTTAHLAFIDGKWFVVQFFKALTQLQGGEGGSDVVRCGYDNDREVN